MDEEEARAGHAREDVPEEYEAEANPEGEAAVPVHISRRAFAIGLAALGLACIGGTVAMTAVSCNAQADGQITKAAGSAADSLMGMANSSGRDVRDRAIAGEGIVRGTVCIDAGHGGGYDGTQTPIGPGSSVTQDVEPGGTSGIVTGVDEADVNLAVALLLRDKLANQGVTVVMVREDDSQVYSSEARAEVANACGADIFVRLHCDGLDDTSVSGFATYIPGYNDWTGPIVESSAYAASIMHPIIIAETGANDRGITERTDLAGFNFCQVPVVLFEMGFMSNPDEDIRLNDPTYQDVLAQAICDGTVAYLEAVAE